MSNLRIRPIPDNSAESEDVFTVRVSPAFLVKYGFPRGSFIAIKKPSGPRRVVRLQVSNALKTDENVVLMTNRAQRLYDLRPSDSLSICSTTLQLRLARKVTIFRKEANPACEKQEADGTVERLRTELLKLALVSVGLTFDLTDTDDAARYLIWQIDDNALDETFSIHKGTEVKFLIDHNEDSIPRLNFASSGIGGLWEAQMRLRRLLAEYQSPGLLPKGRKRGILLHGCSGTGKSLLLERLSEAGWRSKARLSKDITKENLHSTFTNALDHQPAIVVIHNLALLGGASSSSAHSSLSRCLQDEFERIDTALVLVVAACRSVLDIDQDLRDVQYFGREIEVPVPDSAARTEILRIHAGLRDGEPNRIIEKAAAQTHGYVGSDLVQLLDLAFEEARERLFPFLNTSRDVKISPIDTHQLAEHDFQHALDHVRPTALKEIFVETPHVAWTDIAGQDDVKQYLEQAIMWPYRYSEKQKVYGVRSSNGLLLYGPPGCSKTMIAKAAATESGLNFIAVSGAELLNMYVGETERAIRNLFAKARAASPCIIFFDEMEAIASSRTRSGGSSNAVYSVTTLLTEMDGITGSKGLFMLGATNQPEMIDFALLRPGRLDRTLYVGAPDEEARSKILSKETQGMPLDDVNLLAIAREAEGMSGAEVVELCQAASRYAWKRDVETGQEQKITLQDFHRALDVVPRSITEEIEKTYADFASRMGGAGAPQASVGLGTEL